MNKVKFIYNPYSGENSIISDIDKVIMIYQNNGYSICPFRISNECSFKDAFKDVDKSYAYILIAGGDGTIDRVVNYMKINKINKPIAILPTGTANDFARFLGIPLNIEDACEQIINSKPKKIDLGKINDRYFVNVASTGLFTDVSQKTDVNLKNTIGRLAYYVKGFEQLPNFRSLKVSVESKDITFDGEMYLMLVFNGQTAGNFNLAYKAEVDDGLLDVIIIKTAVFMDIVGLFVKVLKTEHLENVNGLLYFKAERLKIYCDEDIVTDIDGEKGPNFPLDISCEKQGIEVYGIKNK